MAKIASPLSPRAVARLEAASVLKDQLSGLEIQLLATHMIMKSFKKGETIMEHGAPATSVMFLISGELQVILDGQLRGSLLEGDLFGEAMFSEEATRTADVVARTDAEVAEFTLEQYEGLLVSHPELALKVKRLFEAIYRGHRERDEKFQYKDTTRYLALVAHNEMKSSLVSFVKQHKSLLETFPLVATGTTGLLLHDEAGVVLSRRVKSGPLGGDQAIGAMIASDNILGLLFFRDPLSAHPHHADIEALGRLCDVYQVPFATNSRTATAVLSFLCERPEALDVANPALDRYQDQQARVLKPAGSRKRAPASAPKTT
jgi:methylglyoxal synthase